MSRVQGAETAHHQRSIRGIPQRRDWLLQLALTDQKTPLASKCGAASCDVSSETYHTFHKCLTRGASAGRRPPLAWLPASSRTVRGHDPIAHKACQVGCMSGEITVAPTVASIRTYLAFAGEAGRWFCRTVSGEEAGGWPFRWLVAALAVDACLAHRQRPAALGLVSTTRG